MKYSKYPFYISQLIIKSLKGQLTEAEQEELDRWLTIEANRVLYLSLSRRNLDDKKNLYGQLHPERTWECLEKRLYLSCCCFVISYDQHCRLPVLETVSFCFYPHGLADGTASGFSQGIFGFCIRRNGKSGR